jgi:hypothetical protein
MYPGGGLRIVKGWILKAFLSELSVGIFRCWLQKMYVRIMLELLLIRVKVRIYYMDIFFESGYSAPPQNILRGNQLKNGF